MNDPKRAAMLPAHEQGWQGILLTSLQQDYKVRAYEVIGNGVIRPHWIGGVCVFRSGRA
jgi:hypothetical protein